MKRGLTRQIRRLAIATIAIALLMAVAAGIAFYFQLHVYDDLIAAISAEYNVPPGLIRAVIWRESRFNRRRTGSHNEIGLMQITMNAARDWASATHADVPERAALFKPEMNIRIGTWYLQRAISYWSAKPNPLPYALAEYNAGRSNVTRWAAHDNNDPNVFWNSITYPSTRKYVREIMSNYRRNR